MRKVECTYDNVFFFFFQAEDGIRDDLVTGVQTCALPILRNQLANIGLCVADGPAQGGLGPCPAQVAHP